jgi:pyrroline-5-carboxylate reductase
MSSLRIVAFIGGGNMAQALIGGLRRSGRAAADILVVEPDAAQRARLLQNHGVHAMASAEGRLASAGVVVWAVKPQYFAAAAEPCAASTGHALQLSVMAGIRLAQVARASGGARVVRAMPNTPALIGRGIAGLHAGPGVTADERAAVDGLFAPTGQTLWVDREEDLDAVTALSGSGPAYVFYVLEAMVASAVAMGLSAEQGRALALATFDGATALAAGSPLELSVLRAQVTSRGGTTQAAIETLEAAGVQAAFARALQAAQQRARELGDAFG